jgi:glycosidase
MSPPAGPPPGATGGQGSSGRSLPAYRIVQIARRFREKYAFEGPFTTDFRAARELAHRMGSGGEAGSARGAGGPGDAGGPDRPAGPGPARAIRASEINALALIEEILRYVVHLYLRQASPQLFRDLLDTPRARVPRLGALLPAYVREFPPLETYRPRAAGADPGGWLTGDTGGFPNRHLAAQGLFLLQLADRNPAYAPYRELLDSGPLARRKTYPPLYDELHRFFESRPRFGPDDQNLVDMLRSPAVASPDSLFGQLEYIRYRWGALLGDYLERLLRALDFLREEQKLRLPAAGLARPPEYSEADFEGERYSQDRDWMPRLVLMAKSTLVWLDQLSRRYGRHIRTLDQVPDEELDTLARWGFTGLWLIGIWERSPASRTIKRLCGNPEAESSAYSLARYRVAETLGGEAALEALAARCRSRGIRLASDMVPNHTGLDSDWVREHPEWFIQVDSPPFPGYTFGGPNLCGQPGIGIFLEDHYYNRSDAAVVFRRSDAWGTRFLYHGNDGTHLPWNDTAQLDYLKPEVREAVIQEILSVARRFRIIRFDAAMTLTRRHYQRLWYPEPGSGGDIPSRAEHGLTRPEFQSRMPQEFWREVVERVAAEAPDTLLLAEAFWLMEGYFVRTLGMHRVYNSAFMNMLKTEDNRGFRTLIKNTLEFDPQILKRYVNFLNNPDEETAVAQFGTGDKYFGVCLLMATLPGLPMFGHGQAEGLREKYGMEYSRAYVDESPDAELIARHEREIFPLLRRRYLFAEVEHFRLFDLYTHQGTVNEDVFAFTNRAGYERALVLYNNRYAEARGWLRRSAAFKGPGEGLVQEDLGQALGLPAEAGVYCRFREMHSGLEYLRPARDLYERGLYVELGAYRCQVLLDFREVREALGAPYAELDAALGGRGVPSLDDALADLVLRPVQQGFRAAYDPAAIRAMAEAGAGRAGAAAPGGETVEPSDAASLARAFFGPLARLPGMGMDVGERAQAAARLLARARELELGAAGRMAAGDWALLWAWVLLTVTPGQGRRLLEELRLEWVIRPAWEAMGFGGEQASGNMALLRLLLALRPWLESLPREGPPREGPQQEGPQQEGPKEAAGLRRGLDSEEGRAALRLPPGASRLDPAAWGRVADWIAGLAALLDPEPQGARKRAADRAAGWTAAARSCDYRFPELLERLDA